jgi:hypothetical protein
VERSQMQAMRTVADLHAAALALRDARKAALQPPPPGDSSETAAEDRNHQGSKAGGENVGGDSADASRETLNKKQHPEQQGD